MGYLDLDDRVQFGEFPYILGHIYWGNIHIQGPSCAPTKVNKDYPDHLTGRLRSRTLGSWV